MGRPVKPFHKTSCVAVLNLVLDLGEVRNEVLDLLQQPCKEWILDGAGVTPLNKQETMKCRQKLATHERNEKTFEILTAIELLISLTLRGKKIHAFPICSNAWISISWPWDTCWGWSYHFQHLGNWAVWGLSPAPCHHRYQMKCWSCHQRRLPQTLWRDWSTRSSWDVQTLSLSV